MNPATSNSGLSPIGQRGSELKARFGFELIRSPRLSLWRRFASWMGDQVKLAEVLQAGHDLADAAVKDLDALILRTAVLPRLPPA